MKLRAMPVVFALFLMHCGGTGDGEGETGGSDLPKRDVSGSDPESSANANGSDPGAPLPGAPGAAPAPFSPKKTCDAAAEIGGSVPDGYTRDIWWRRVRAKPGSPAMFGWVRLPLDPSSGLEACTEVASFGAGGWSAGCAPRNAESIVVSGSDILSFDGDPLDVSRNWGAPFASLQRVSTAGMSARLAMGTAGHGAVAWHDGANLHLGRIAPKATAVTELPSIPGEHANDYAVIELTVDALGDGFVVWTRQDGTLAARGWQGSTWMGDPVVIDGTSYASHTSALVGLGAGKAWIHVDTDSTMKAVTLSVANGATVVSEEPGIETSVSYTMSVVSAPDGELTIVTPRAAAEEDTFNLVAKRRLATGAWTPETVLATLKTLYRPDSAIAIDADGHVTMVHQDLTGAVIHRRAEKGSATWTDPVVVATPSAALAMGHVYEYGVFVTLQLAIEPVTRDPIVAFDVAASESVATVYQARCH
jgi:hypothetical protein